MTEAKKAKKEIDFKLDTEEMAQAGLHFGHRVSRIHSKMKPYLFGVRSSVHIIDLEKTAEKLKEALAFLAKFVAEGKIILFVGTKIQVKELVKKVAKDCGMPYVVERWLGGTLTNFENMKKRLEYFKELETRQKEGEFEKYTKKEKAQFEQELKILEIKFGGLRDFTKLPEAVFVLDMKKDALAIREAKAKGLKVIAIADTNVDPTLADYPIPANDDAVSSVTYILEKAKETILKTKLPPAEAKVKKGVEPSSSNKPNEQD